MPAICIQRPYWMVTRNLETFVSPETWAHLSNQQLGIICPTRNLDRFVQPEIWECCPTRKCSNMLFELIPIAMFPNQCSTRRKRINAKRALSRIWHALDQGRVFCWSCTYVDHLLQKLVSIRFPMRAKPINQDGPIGVAVQPPLVYESCINIEATWFRCLGIGFVVPNWSN